MEAVKATNDGFNDIVGLLEKISEDPNESPGTRGDAEKLLHNILMFNLFALLSFWYDILANNNRVQKRLQDPSINSQEASRDIEAFQVNLSSTRDDLCQRSVEKGKERCTEWEKQIQRWVRRRKIMPGELGRDDGLSAEQELMRVMRSSLDRLQQEMIKIFTRLKDPNAKFGFLLDTIHLMEVEQQDSTDATLCQNCNDLATVYHTISMEANSM